MAMETKKDRWIDWDLEENEFTWLQRAVARRSEEERQACSDGLKG